MAGETRRAGFAVGKGEEDGVAWGEVGGGGGGADGEDFAGAWDWQLVFGGEGWGTGDGEGGEGIWGSTVGGNKNVIDARDERF